MSYVGARYIQRQVKMMIISDYYPTNWQMQGLILSVYSYGRNLKIVPIETLLSFDVSIEK